jgi:hypothetical protein
MKTIEYIRTCLLSIGLLLITHMVSSQPFPSGGYQNGNHGSGGDEILVGIARPVTNGQNGNFLVFPNPIHDRTTIMYTLSFTGRIELELYDMNNRLIRTFNTPSPADKGTYSITWAGDDGNGNKLAMGVYYLKFTTGTVSLAKKLMIL